MKAFLEPLTSEKEQEYIEKMMSGDKRAKDELIERNMRLVAHIAKKYYAENRDNEDLISIGTIGLIKAVNSYNPTKGNRLGTYAAKCIEKATPSIRLQRAKRTKIRPLLLAIGVHGSK